MKTFLEEVAEHIHEKHKSFNDVVFVLPSKRAGIFLRRHIASFLDKPIFSPKIYSIEELIGEISGLEVTTSIDLLLELYEAFLPHLKNDDKRFESFISWGNTLLSDFNEIDRNLVQPEALFNYLTANQRIKNWGADERATPLISNTIKFWDRLHPVYTTFSKQLLQKGLGHQGLLYREAANKVKGYLATVNSQTFYFVGFNALNIAEEHIVQAFMDNGTSTVYWDTDTYFINDNIHEAGLFIRNYLKKWPQTKVVSGKKSLFTSKKTIKITGVPKSISQAKYAGDLVKNIVAKNKEQHIALVLSDETLLSAMLNSLPALGKRVNITMGLSLKKTNLYDFFNSLFNLHIQKTEKGWFYKDVNKLLSNPTCIQLLNTSENGVARHLGNHIKEKNILFLTRDILDKEPFSKCDVLQVLFSQNDIFSKAFIKTCQHLIQILKENYQESHPKELHQLYAYFRLFNQLSTILDSRPYLNSIKALKFLFNELVAIEKIDFKGEPLGGLQIMGVLESRNLDFETVVLTSVNEGILPAGKNQNSFIPYDIKKEFGLPTYKEKDAIYAYHFYRLLQRAKTVHILYNTAPDVLMGNEKSRFISQLLTDVAINENIVHETASPQITISPIKPREIIKTSKLVNVLHDVSRKGFSPTALTNYIKNPYEFYKSNVLRLKEIDDVQENMAHNVFGTIVHDCLEELYVPCIGQKLTLDNLNPLKERIAPIVQSNFEKHFTPKAIETGQNLIAFHVVQKYLASFISFDLDRIKSDEITILSLEKPFKSEILMPGYTHPVFLKGKLDRLERVNGRMQILDYKTGNTTQSEVELRELENCFTNEKRAKAFQLLCYALMVHKETRTDQLSAAIVPIKKINSGLLWFAQKNGPRGPKNTLITSELVHHFEQLLSNLILEILNPSIPFEQKASIAL